MGDLFMDGGAQFDDRREYRYHLWRRWGAGPTVLWILCNPSTADEHELDPTLRRVADYTEQWGFNRFDVVNIFAWRSTEFRALLKVPDPVGPQNDAMIVHFAQRAHLVMCGWGALHVQAKWRHADRHEQVRRLLRGVPLRCLKRTQEGHPNHPLYLAADLKPVPFNVD